MVRGAILTMSGNPLGAVISSDVTIFHEFHHSSPKPGIGIWPEELPPSIYNRSRTVCSSSRGWEASQGQPAKIQNQFLDPSSPTSIY